MSELQQLIWSFSTLKKILEKELKGFNDLEFAESQTDTLQHANDLLEMFGTIQIGNFGIGGTSSNEFAEHARIAF